METIEGKEKVEKCLERFEVKSQADVFQLFMSVFMSLVKPDTPNSHMDLIKNTKFKAPLVHYSMIPHVLPPTPDA